VAGSADTQQKPQLHLWPITTALYRRERTGKGSYVPTSLLAAGILVAASLSRPLYVVRFFLMDCTMRTHPANAVL